MKPIERLTSGNKCLDYLSGMRYTGLGIWDITMNKTEMDPASLGSSKSLIHVVAFS